MKKTADAQQANVLKTAAQAIGTTLGRLAVATGLEHPAVLPLVKKTPAPRKVTSKTAVKKTSPTKKAALKKVAKKVAKRTKK
jgi:hypothetical protein